jgi:hypothetical protein
LMSAPHYTGRLHPEKYISLRHKECRSFVLKAEA